jgi:N-acyl-D-amino-acid deacylase
VKVGELLIAATTSALHVAGKRLGQVAADMGTSSEEALLTLVEHGGSEVLVFDECLEPETVRTLTEHPLGLVSSNGAGFPLTVQEHLVHPRSFGTTQTYLRQVLTDKRISLAEAVRKLTASPAKVLGLANRGTIAPGYMADVVLINPQTLESKATLTNPFQVGNGIDYVFVGGKLAAQQGAVVDGKQGQFLVKNA